MKTIQPIRNNVSKELILKVTFSDSFFRKKENYIFVTEKPHFPKGYAAYILIEGSDVKTGAADNIIVIRQSDSAYLNEGDVVLVEPRSAITVEYEKSSLSNSIILTEKCNHRCVMCPQPPKNDQRNLLPFNLKLLSLYDKDTAEIGITGGEPTLAGDDLFIIIDFIKKHLKKASVTLLTNGVKFSNPEFTASLAKCNHPDLQVDIPLYSDLPEMHNYIVGAKTFYKTVDGLYNLASFKQKIGIRVVVHKLNYERLEDISYYIYRNFPFVAQVAFMQMEIKGYAEDNIKELWIDPFDYKTELTKAVKFLSLRKLPVYIYNTQLCILPEEIRHHAMCSISEWKNIFLEECHDCQLRPKCAGFFSSSESLHSSRIKAIMKGV